MPPRGIPPAAGGTLAGGTRRRRRRGGCPRDPSAAAGAIAPRGRFGGSTAPTPPAWGSPPVRRLWPAGAPVSRRVPPPPSGSCPPAASVALAGATTADGARPPAKSAGHGEPHPVQGCRASGCRHTGNPPCGAPRGVAWPVGREQGRRRARRWRARPAAAARVCMPRLRGRLARRRVRRGRSTASPSSRVGTIRARYSKPRRPRAGSGGQRETKTGLGSPTSGG